MKRPHPGFPQEELMRFYREEAQMPPPIAYRVLGRAPEW